MKRFVIVVGVVIALAQGADAQFKSQLEHEARISDGVLQRSEPSLLFGWFDPERFQMRHSVSFSYHTMGGQSFSLGTYTNSMTYQFADNLLARADVSMSYSPFQSVANPLMKGKNSSLSSIYLSRAELNYKPWENVTVHFQFRQSPYGYYSPYYSPFSSPWYREDGF